MIAAKKFFIGLLAAIILNVAAAHAEEVDPYFTWEIKNPDDYRDNQMFNKIVNRGIEGGRDEIDEIYKRVEAGKYFEAARMCEIYATYQKIFFGVDYFDAGLTELNAKLYLQADELDAAKHKINFLLKNAPDNMTKIRALILKADLLNRREKFAEALQAAQEADELLKTAPDEKLSLMTCSRMARAYCGLGDTKKLMDIANKISLPIQKTFGEDSVENLSLISTVAEISLKVFERKISEQLLKIKTNKIVNRYKRTKTNLPVVAEVKAELANFYFETGDAAQGINFLTEAINFAYYFDNDIHSERRVFKKINCIASKHLDANHPLVLNSEFSMVHANSKFGNIPSAITFYQNNLPKFKRLFGEDNLDTRDMMRLLSDDYLTMGNYAAAKKFADEQLNVCRKHFGEGDYRTINATIALANILYRTGQYKHADQILDDLQGKNIDYFAKSPAPKAAYDVLFKRATGARLRGDIYGYADCLKKLDKLLEVNSLAYNDLMLEGFKLISMSGFSHGTRDFESIILNCINLMAAQHRPDALFLRNDIALSHVAYGDLSEAERQANEILRLSRTHLGNGNFYERLALNTLAQVRRAEGKFAEALELDGRALMIAENVCGKKSLERLQALDAVASDRAALGDVDTAIKLRQQTLTEYKKFFDDDDDATVQMMTNLAGDYVTAGRYADAVKLCDETFARLKVPTLTNSHLSYFPAITDTVRVKADALRLSGNAADALTNYKQLIQVYEAERIGNSYIGFGTSSAENNARWFAEVVPVYKNAAAVAATVDDTDFAFYCTEFCKGRSLIDRYADVVSSKSYLFTPAEKNELNAYGDLLKSARALIDRAADDETLATNADVVYENVRLIAENFKSELREKYSVNMVPKDESAYKAKNMNFGLWDQMDPNVWEQPSIWDWNEILKNFDVRKNSAAIPNGACLIEFLKASDNSLVVTFLSNDGEVQAVKIPVDEKFFDDCKLYHDLISYPDINSMSEFGKKYLWQIGDEYKITDIREKTAADEKSVNDPEKFFELRQKLCAELSEKLLPTLERFAGKFSYWIISPDAELNLVPFETLTYRGKFLVDEKNVSYVPSLAVMNLMRNRERKNSYLGRNKELFAMGDAIYSDNDETATRGSFDENSGLAGLKWSNLPGAARELDKISALFESKNIFRREQASEKNLRQLNSSGELSQYKYLLFSAHGIFVPQRPELSSIVLSQNFDAEFDGYVTVGEWMSYDLRSDLIYLSACESGRGSYQAGEGIVGIPYALTVAGNKDTVMSLWKVNDAATAEFTSAVFEKLSRGKSEVDAINETKREFLSNPIYRDPSIWAAFVLYGI